MYLIVSYPPLCNIVKVIISNDFVCEVHMAIVKVVGEQHQLGKDGRILVLWNEIFHETFCFDPLIPHSI